MRIHNTGGCFMKVLRQLIFLAVSIAFCAQSASGQHQAVPKLTLVQIEQLVSHGVPDATLSRQIRIHGIIFKLTPAILGELRAKGAGPLTLSTIQETPSGASERHSPQKEPQQRFQEVPPSRDWTSSTPMPLPPNCSLDCLRTAEMWEGGQYGLGSTRYFGANAAVFSAANSSRIEYGPYISSEGTLELWIKVNHGYRYDDYQFKDNQDDAMIFSTDCQGGDVTWPGTLHLVVKSNGDISLWMANYKYNQPPAQATEAKGTTFRFGEWHAIGISYGSQGQWIMLDGRIVASSPFLTQALGRAGNHQEPLDIATVGETACHFWDHHRYEGGFDGILGGVRLSRAQRDWALALNRPGRYGTVMSGPLQENEDTPSTREQKPRVNIAAGVAVGMLLEKPQPVYPPIAKAAHVSGTVVLQTTISKTGTVEDPNVVSGPPLLQQAALDAVKTWRYRPYLLNNEPVAVETTINVNFTLGAENNQQVGDDQNVGQPVPRQEKPWLETAYEQLSSSNFDQAEDSLNHAIETGLPVALPSIIKKALFNQHGTLYISKEGVWFVDGNKEVFRAPVAQVTAGKFGNAVIAGPAAYYFELSVAGKKYRFEYQPKNVDCSFYNGDNLICEGNGFAQQRVVAEWVQETVSRYSVNATKR